VRMPTGYPKFKGLMAPIASCPIKLIIDNLTIGGGSCCTQELKAGMGKSLSGEMPQGVYSFILTYEYILQADGI